MDEELQELEAQSAADETGTELEGIITEEAGALEAPAEMPGLAAPSASGSAAEAAFQQQNEREQQLQQTGLDRNLLNQMIAQNPIVQQAQAVIEQTRIAEGQHALDAQLAEIGRLDLAVKSLADIIGMPTFGDFDRRVRQGYSIADAYKLANFDSLGQKRSAAAKQAALNAVNGKGHLTATTGGAGENVIVPAETMHMYRQMFPGWTDKQIMQDYKKRR